jgi:hypothetical protein
MLNQAKHGKVRFSEDEDRIACAENLKRLIHEGKLSKLKGEQNQPPELLKACVQNRHLKEAVAIFEAQWNVIKESVLAEAKKLKEERGETFDLSKGLGKLLAMSDVSGSMMSAQYTGDLPFWVSISLAIMVSELVEGAFKNMMMTFTEIPHFLQFPPNASLLEKYDLILSKGVGYSTQFGKAMEELLNMCVRFKVNEEDIPNLIVFTDGQFDQMNRSDYGNKWTTHHSRLLSMWAKAGYTKMPTIIYWNLNANTPGFQTSADHPGTTMLQGFSPSLLKFVLFGENLSETEVEVQTADGVVKMKTQDINPLQTMRSALDQDCYAPVLEVLMNSKEGVFLERSFAEVSK